MSKDPAFLFYVNDYLGGTMGFTLEMHGAYLTMLLYQYNNGPFTDEKAISIIGKIWDSIQHKFNRKNGSGFRYNVKMENVIKQRENFSTSRRESALKRWNKNDKPLSGTKIDDIHMQCTRNANAMRGGNGNGNGNKEGVKGEKKFIPPSFEEAEKFCSEHGFKNIAKKVFEYYSTADWHDSRGKKIKNWKQKFIAVWFKEENKDRLSQQPDSPYSQL